MKKRHCSHKISVTSNATQLTDISLQEPIEVDERDDEPKQSRPTFSRSISTSRSIKRQKSLTMQTLKEENCQAELLRRDDQETEDNLVTKSTERNVSQELIFG